MVILDSVDANLEWNDVDMDMMAATDLQAVYQIQQHNLIQIHLELIPSGCIPQ